MRTDSFVQTNIHSTTKISSLQDNASEQLDYENISDIWPSTIHSSTRSRSSYTGQFSEGLPFPYSQDCGELPDVILSNPNAESNVITTQASEMGGHLPLPMQVSGEASPNPRGWDSFKKRARAGFARRWSWTSRGSRRSPSLSTQANQSHITDRKETAV